MFHLWRTILPCQNEAYSNKVSFTKFLDLRRFMEMKSHIYANKDGDNSQTKVMFDFNWPTNIEEESWVVALILCEVITEVSTLQVREPCKFWVNHVNFMCCFVCSILLLFPHFFICSINLVFWEVYFLTFFNSNFWSKIELGIGFILNSNQFLEDFTIPFPHFPPSNQ